MTTSSDENPATGIDDDQLPDDLVAGEDNPLAEGLESGETAGDLLDEGKPAAESADGHDSGDGDENGGGDGGGDGTD